MAQDGRSRAARRSTTRLVGRCRRGGGFSIRYEELSAESPLVAPPDRVIYQFLTGGGESRLFIGFGVGPAGTARALLADVERFITKGAGQ